MRLVFVLITLRVKCMEKVYFRRRVAVSVLLALLVFAICLLGQNLIHG